MQFGLTQIHGILIQQIAQVKWLVLTMVLKKRFKKVSFSTIINLPKGTYFISILLDENFNNILDKNFIGIPSEQYGFSTKKQIRFRKPKFDEGSIEFFKNTILNIELQ